jgi:biopolymer transport protein ExbD
MSFGGFEKQNNAPMSEINTTPLVDVMLVLLIIFIITAPILTNAVNVDLPSSKTVASTIKPNVINVSLDKNEQIFLNGKKVEIAELTTFLKQEASKKKETELYLQADKDIRYEKIIEVMTEAKKAGITKLGFVSKAQGK